MVAGEQACVFLKWDDWPVTSEDFDLGLFAGDGTLVAASSNDQSDGPLPADRGPLLHEHGADPGLRDRDRALQREREPAVRPLLLRRRRRSQFATADGSVTEPASSPDALAVGADCWQTGTLEPYSSQGPTIDGRTKPDLLAPDSVSTQTYGAATAGAGGCGASGFAGTSAASPQVAGAAADLLEQSRRSPRPSSRRRSRRDRLRVAATSRAPTTSATGSCSSGPLRATARSPTSRSSTSTSPTPTAAGRHRAPERPCLRTELVAGRLAARDRHEQRPRDDRCRRVEPADHRFRARVQRSGPVLVTRRHEDRVRNQRQL